MPNHCENDLKVTGPDADIQRMLEEIGKYEVSRPGLDSLSNQAIYGEAWLPVFDKVIPYPTNLRELDDKVAKQRELVMAMNADERRKFSEQSPEGAWGKDGYNSGGYEWCIANWGTKWDAYSPMGFSRSDGKVFVTFQTAWSPPKPVILAASKMFPSLKFSLRWYEMGMGFKGVFTAKAGEIIKEEESKYSGTRGG